MTISNLSVNAVRLDNGAIVADVSFDSSPNQLSYLQIGEQGQPYSSYGFQFVAPAGGTIYINNAPRFVTYIGTQFGPENPIPEWTDGSFRPDKQYTWRIAEWDLGESFNYYEGPIIDTTGLFGGLPWGPNDIAEYPFNYTATHPEQSLGPYSVLFGWLGIAGENWTLEYTEIEDFSIVASYDVSGLDYFSSPAEFQPDILYYWRIRLPSVDYDGIPFIVPFGAPPEVILDEYPYAPQEPNEAPVNEPDDLVNLPQANLGNKLHSAAASIRAARQRIRDWADS